MSVLGPVLVRRGDVEVDLGTLRQREIIAALALTPGQAVPSSVLIDRVWGDDAPPSALATLHGYVAALRRALEPDRPPRAPSTALVTQGDTYTLHVTPDQVDETRFDTLVGDARSLLGVVPDHLRPRVAPQDREVVEQALDKVDEALALWRGTPYAELDDDPVASAQRVRLDGRRRMAEELRAVGQLALGRHDLVRGELEVRTAQYPLHERWWALRAVALARETRQADALAVLDDLRAHLAEELGVDPSPPLQALRTAILRQDPTVTEASDVSVAPPTAPHGAIRTPSAAWGLVGREADLRQLTSSLDLARAGRTTFAAVTGGPGIGKTRLITELAAIAQDRGCTVAIGQCSQDDGAPPFWPWFSVLDALEVPFEQPDPGLEGGGLFRVRSDIVAAVRDAAADHPLLLVLEDLHWADSSTLGVLRLLVESVGDRRLLVVATWRSPHESARDLSGVAEAFARRHAVRRELRGLDLASTSALFERVGGTSLGPDRALGLHESTGGNPFFVVEFARLAGSGDDDPFDVAGSGALPTVVADVTEQRLAGLPEPTTTILRTAAVVGRSFDLETLGDVTRMRPDDLLDAVEPAVAAGVLDEEDVEVFRFSHALVRDVLSATMSATRLARTHRLVAEILEQRPGREAEVARHWRAAGPRHVGRAWRAASDAARAAASVYGYDDAAELLEGALALQATDPEAGPRDELTLLHQAIDVYRWAAMRPQLVAAVERGIVVARSLDDVVALARIAVQGTHRMLWRSAPYGAVNDVVVGALRQALHELPDDEVELRCRALVSLANELRHEAPVDERRRLVDEADRLARRSGDDALLCDVLLHDVTSTWVPATATSRLASVEEALRLAHAVEDRQAWVMAAALRAIVLGETGRVSEMWPSLDATRAAASALRMVYIELVCDELELVWRAAAGDWVSCDLVLDRIEANLALASRTGAAGGLAVENTIDVFGLRLWQGRALDAVPELEEGIALGYPHEVFVAVALGRGGRRDDAAAALRATDVDDLLDHELSFSLPLWCAVAEGATYAGDRDLARRAHERLAPYAGWSSGANGLFLGPVDAFLAMAARTGGDADGAARHAADASSLLEAWDLPVARAWFTGVRRDLGL